MVLMLCSMAKVDVCVKKSQVQVIVMMLLQGAQAVGMGVEAQKVPAAAELFSKANEILGCV